MKKLLFTAAAITGIVSANAQPIMYDHLDINNIKAQVNSEGSLFWNFALGQFETPKGSGRHTIFANALWIGGFDASNTLKVAGQVYRQMGTDFWPGPLDATGSTSPTTIAAFNRVWKLNQCDIDNYHAWLMNGMMGPNPVDSAATYNILNWPATGVAGAPLAPYNDNNANGSYDPYAGDTPKIKGDQAIFFVYNDMGGPHTETGGTAIGLEIQTMVYGYACPDDSALYNTVFTNYKIINKSSFRLDSTFIGNWTDFDIGSASDDFVECDVKRGAYYAYNGDSIDDNAPSGQIPYGANPPAQAVTFLAGPYADPNGLDDLSGATPNGMNYGDAVVDNERLGMSRFLYYNNDGSSTGNPSSPPDFYNYISGSWKDATNWTYGGTGHLTGVTTHYIFPGASDPLGYGTNGVPQSPWDEFTVGNTPADRRGVGSYGPFTFQPGMVEELDFAYVYGKATSGGNLASVAVMKDRIDSVKQKFSDGIPLCGCSGTTGINTVTENNSFSIYPNPASDNITVSFRSMTRNAVLKVYDAQGKLVRSMENLSPGEINMPVGDLSDGLYLINLQEDTKSTIKRFIKQ